MRSARVIGCSFVLTAKPRALSTWGLVPSRTSVDFHSAGDGAAFTPASIDLTVTLVRSAEGASVPAAWPSPYGTLDIGGVTHHVVWRCYDATGAIVATYSGGQPLGWDRSWANTSGSNDRGNGLTRLDGGVRISSTTTISAVEFAIACKSPESISGEADIISRVTVPVTHLSDGDTGPAGPDGRGYYMAGTYSNQRKYTKVGGTPVVFLDDGTWNEVLQCNGGYWSLTRDTNVVGGVHYPPNDSNGYWRQEPTFGVVITQGTFADFAHISKSVTAFGYQFSADGRIGGTAYADGDLYNGRPAWTYFKGDPSEQTGTFFEPNWWVNLKTGRQYQGDTTVKGTVKADVLYRGYRRVDIDSGAASYMLRQACGGTLPSLVYVNPIVPTAEQATVGLVLPHAKDCEGLQLELVCPQGRKDAGGRFFPQVRLSGYGGPVSQGSSYEELFYSVGWTRSWQYERLNNVFSSDADYTYLRLQAVADTLAGRDCCYWTVIERREYKRDGTVVVVTPDAGGDPASYVTGSQMQAAMNDLADQFSDALDGCYSLPQGGIPAADLAQAVQAALTAAATAYGWGDHALAGYLTSHQTVTDLAATLAFGSTVTIARIGGTAITVALPASPDTTYTLSPGDENGQIKVTPSAGSPYNVSVTGLAALAFKAALSASDIPALPASKVTSGTFSAARIPSLPQSKVTGLETVLQSISSALQNKQEITSGANTEVVAAAGRVLASISVDAMGHVTAVGAEQLEDADIPALPASKVTSGTFSAARIPALPASKITSGTFNADRIPMLPASKINGLEESLNGKLETHQPIYLHTTTQDILVNGGGHITFVAGNNVTMLANVEAGTLTFSATDTTYRLTLNGSTNGTAGGTALGSFYAPTGAGTAGQFLKSAGSGAPQWGGIAAGDIPSLPPSKIDKAVTLPLSLSNYKVVEGEPTVITQLEAPQQPGQSIGTGIALASYNLIQNLQLVSEVGKLYYDEAWHTDIIDGQEVRVWDEEWYLEDIGKGIGRNSGYVNTTQNTLRDVELRHFSTAVDFESMNYSSIQRCFFYFNALAIDVHPKSGSTWAGGIDISDCHIYINYKGIHVSGANGTTHIRKCTFEGCMTCADVTGGVTFVDCYFGDQHYYGRGCGSANRRLAVVGPGSSVIFERCSMGFSADPTASGWDFMFELNGTDADPCTVTLRDCTLTLGNQYVSAGNGALKAFLYKTLSEKNTIIFENCRINYATANDHWGWWFYAPYKNAADTDYTGKVCQLRSIGQAGCNYIVNGYFTDTVGNALMERTANVSVLDKTVIDPENSANNVYPTKNMFGGYAVKMTPYYMRIPYEVPDALVGTAMSLELCTDYSAGANTPSVYLEQSDCEETGRTQYTGRLGKTSLINFTPTKRRGVVTLYLGGGEVTVYFVRLVEMRFRGQADVLPCPVMRLTESLAAGVAGGQLSPVIAPHPSTDTAYAWRIQLPWHGRIESAAKIYGIEMDLVLHPTDTAVGDTTIHLAWNWKRPGGYSYAWEAQCTNAFCTRTIGCGLKVFYHKNFPTAIYVRSGYTTDSGTVLHYQSLEVRNVRTLGDAMEYDCGSVRQMGVVLANAPVTMGNAAHVPEASASGSIPNADWNSYAASAAEKTWLGTSALRGSVAIGDLFAVSGGDDGSRKHTLFYRSTTDSGNLRGVCIGHVARQADQKEVTGNLPQGIVVAGVRILPDGADMSVWEEELFNALNGTTAASLNAVVIGKNHNGRMDVSAPGGVTVDSAVTATAFTQSSDARMKSVTGDVGLTAEQVAHAPSVRFRWKDGMGDDREHVGTLAQYWLQVLPQAVGEDGDGRLTLDYGVAALASAVALARELQELRQLLVESGKRKVERG